MIDQIAPNVDLGRTFSLSLINRFHSDGFSHAC